MAKGPDMSRDMSKAGQTVQQGNQSVTYDSDGYAKSATKTSDSPGYVVDGVTYGGGSGGGSSSGGSTSASSTQYSSGASATSDYSQYLKDLYASQTASQLAALKSAYDQNTSDLKAQATKIPQTYYAARNDAAAQNEVAKQSFNEYAVSRGLNTGTSGQAALANSAVLQKNLSSISTSEADALSENALAAQKLKFQYDSAINQAQASGDTQLAQALYQEYVRQSEAQAAEDSAAQSQSNWEKQYDAQQQQYANSQNQWQQEFDYNKTSDAQTYANNLAKTMLSMGVMPDSSTLAAAGISSADALAMRLAVLQSASASSVKSTSTKKPSVKSSGGSGSGNTPVATYDNGSLTPAQVKTLQNYYGVPADGAWGAASSKAAGSLGADQAWYNYKLNSGGSTGGMGIANYNGLKRTILTYAGAGKNDSAASYIAANWDSLNSVQQSDLKKYLAEIGISI
ncbi:hypothetical protein [Oscillibacter sp.]|uniref:hypothetical protein n=1 Tax=Oscillibacter sp. TaxID=1945593 RepID=UPI003394E22D